MPARRSSSSMSPGWAPRSSSSPHAPARRRRKPSPNSSTSGCCGDSMSHRSTSRRAATSCTPRWGNQSATTSPAGCSSARTATLWSSESSSVPRSPTGRWSAAVTPGGGTRATVSCRTRPRSPPTTCSPCPRRPGVSSTSWSSPANSNWPTWRALAPPPQRRSKSSSTLTSAPSTRPRSGSPTRSSPRPPASIWIRSHGSSASPSSSSSRPVPFSGRPSASATCVGDRKWASTSTRPSWRRARTWR